MKRLSLLVLACTVLALAACQPANPPAAEPPTTTPEVYIPSDQAIPDFGITLEGVHLQIAGSTLSGEFPAGCTGGAPCTKANADSHILAVTFTPRDLPEGNMLAYKNMPDVRIALEGGARVPYSLTLYDNASHSLTLGFQVPAAAKTFGLLWGDLVEIPINFETQQ